MKKPVALAIGAHPDDVEFTMAGTLLLLREAGCEIHVMAVATGSCGSMVHSARALRAIRRREAQASAALLGAEWHPSLTDDLEIVYSVSLLRRLAAVVRKVQPSILLTHPPTDYMEDHANTCRLAVSAAFARAAPNFRSVPRRPPFAGDVTIYHGMPSGLRDPLRRRVMAGAFVNTTRVHARQLEALAQHRSQQEWLDASQKMNSYLATMEERSREVGRMSRRFRYAEGWRRHLHFGFCAAEADPLRDLLGRNYRIDQRYERALERGA